MLPVEYIAGFVDGEGGFGIYPKSVRFTISNTNREVLERIKETVGGGRIATRQPAKSNHSVAYELCLGSKLIRAYLPSLVPHLIVKREAAELMLEYLAPIPICKRGTYYMPSQEELDRRERLRLRMVALNAHDDVGHSRGV